MPCPTGLQRAPGRLILCALLAVAGSRALLANCQNEGPYPIRQCATAAGTPAWFAPAPPGAGKVSATWWILGFGNRDVSDPTLGVSNNPNDGDGFIDQPAPGVFIGVDSAGLTVGVADGEPAGGLDLVDAVVGTGSPLAAGGLCFSAAANWALPFVDGCSDMNRTYSVLGGAANASDNYLNPYFSAATGGPGIITDYALLDSPMGVLLTEETSTWFALAFFSSTDRGGNPMDIFDKGYDMGAIVNGDPNPAVPTGNSNIIPWQTIPLPHITTAIDPVTDDRILSVTWPMIRLVHDGSSRPQTGVCEEPPCFTLGMDRNGLEVLGVGVLEQPELVSFELEKKPIAANQCDPAAPWTAAGPLVVPPITTPPGTLLSTSVMVPADTCVRLLTRFGRVAFASFQTAPADLATRNTNRRNAQLGNLGDIGYSVTHASGVKMIGGPLLGDKAILKRAAINRRGLVVEFQTPSELGVEGFQVMARDQRGTTEIVATLPCDECTSGLGGSYRVEVSSPALRSIKSIFVVVQPSGTISNEIAIERTGDRPRATGRPAPSPSR